MTSSVLLRGYQYSVYTRIARMVLHEKSVQFSYDEVDPFQESVPEDFLVQNPFARVPVLVHGEFVLSETAAITRYIDATFAGPSLEPHNPKAQARLRQVISIIDNYGYVPMVRQVFAHRVFRPSNGETTDELTISDGLSASRIVLKVLNVISAEGLVLCGGTITLADLHLAPMIAYFTQAPEGLQELQNHAALRQWWEEVSNLPNLVRTDPGLPARRA